VKHSVAKILTMHVGGLPFIALDNGIAKGDTTHLAEDVAAIAALQRKIGKAFRFKEAA
jgi:hypothetical protein